MTEPLNSEHGSLKGEKVKETAAQKLKNFGEEVSIVGISQILRAEKKKEKKTALKIMWILAVLVSFVILIVHCTIVLTTYFSWPVDSIYKEGERRPTFPDVTICKPFSKNHQTTHFKNKTGLDKDYDGYIWWKVQDLCSYYENSQSRRENRSSFIIDCNCIDWDWDVHGIKYKSRLYWDFDYGECSTIHLDRYNPTHARGLSLLLFNNKSLGMYTGPFFLSQHNANAQGMRVTVHAPGTRPDLKNGITVGFGTETTLRLFNTNRIRLPSPHGSCTYRKNIDDSDPKSFLYSKNICYDVCIQQQFIDKCSCINSNFYFTSSQNKSLKGSVCGDLRGPDGNWSDEKMEGVWQVNCTANFEPDLDLCAKNCPEPCSEYQYDISGTSAPWPHLSVQLEFYELYIKDNPVYGSKFDIYGEILHNFTKGDFGAIKQLENIHYLEEDFMQLDLFYDSYTMAILEDRPSMTWAKLLSELGGALSLWLGITVMTAFEFLQLFYNLGTVTYVDPKPKPNADQP